MAVQQASQVLLILSRISTKIEHMISKTPQESKLNPLKNEKKIATLLINLKDVCWDRKQITPALRRQMSLLSDMV